MSPDRPSIYERLAEIEQAERAARVVPIRQSSACTPGSVVAYTSPPLTWKQVGKFFLAVTLVLVVAIGGWRFLRVSLQIGKLNSPDAAVRVKAAAELGRFRSSRAVAPLIAVLNDTDPGLQKGAAQALGQIGDLRALEPLHAALKAAKDYDEVQTACAQAMGSLGPSALEPLMADLKDKDLDAAAGSGLEQLGAPAVDPLIATLSDANPDLREQAAEILGEIKDPRAVPPLVAALEDKESSVRKYAAAALGEIKDSRADQPLIAALKDSGSDVRQAAANALGEMDDTRSVTFLLSALNDRNTEVIAGANTFFVQRGVPGSEDALIEALNKYGDESMAEEFLNSGNQKLADAARAWASTNNYEITYTPGGGSTSWGGRK
jgi:HEAT repeat protein